MTQLFNHGKGWETLEQVNARKARENTSDEVNNQVDEQPKRLLRKDIIAELETLKVEFKKNASRDDLLKLLEEVKTESISEEDKARENTSDEV